MTKILKLWRCPEKLHTTPSTTQGNHDNSILHQTIETPTNSLVTLNNIIETNHGEGHLTTYDENQLQNKRTDNDYTCYGGRKCKGLRGLTAHKHSCVVSNLDDLKGLFTQSNATIQQETNGAIEDSTTPLLEKIPVKEGIRLPSIKEEWETANMYFNANLDLQSDITKIENEVLAFQFCIYNYFKLIDKNKDPDYIQNSLFTEYNHLSRRKLKKILNELKSDTNNEDLTRIRYISKFIRVKYGKKGSKLRTEMTHDKRIEKDFWKYCKEISESEDKVLPDFHEKTCYEHFMKSLKKSKHPRDYSPLS